MYYIISLWACLFNAMQNLVSEAANGCLFSAWIHFKLWKEGSNSKAVQVEGSHTGNGGKRVSEQWRQLSLRD